jgi:hypothetical protein
MDSSHLNEVISRALETALFAEIVASAAVITLYNGAWLLRHRHG